MAERRRTRGDGSLYKGDRGDWIAQVWIGGRKVRRRAPSQEAARQALDDLRAQRDRGLAPSDLTVAEWLEQWLEEVVAERNSANTLRSYRQKAQHQIIPHLGRVRLVKLTPQQVHRMTTALHRDGYSPKTIHHAYRTLHMALGQAERWGLVERNVARLAGAPRVPRKERRTLSPAQSLRLVQVLQGDRYEAPILLALLLGLRRGEVQGLRWRDVDLDEGRLRIRQTLVRIDGARRFEEPKAGSARTLSIPASLVMAIECWKQVQDTERVHWRERSELVFTRPFGEPLAEAQPVRALQDILAAHGLPKVTFHDLRHAAASLMVALGEHPRTIAQVLGHATIAMSMETYAHVSDELVRGVAERIDGWISPPQPPTSREA